MRVSDGFYNVIQNIKDLLSKTYNRKFNTIEITEKIAFAIDLIIKEKNSNFVNYDWEFRPIIMYVMPYKRSKKKGSIKIEKILDFFPKTEFLK